MPSHCAIGARNPGEKLLEFSLQAAATMTDSATFFAQLPDYKFSLLESAAGW